MTGLDVIIIAILMDNRYIRYYRAAGCFVDIRLIFVITPICPVQLFTAYSTQDDVLLLIDRPG